MLGAFAVFAGMSQAAALEKQLRCPLNLGGKCSVKSFNFFDKNGNW